MTHTSSIPSECVQTLAVPTQDMVIAGLEAWIAETRRQNDGAEAKAKSDEQRQAYRYMKIGSEMVNSQQFIAAWSAALAAAPTPAIAGEGLQPSVKPLEWKPYATDGSTQKAKTTIAHYVVWEIDGDGFLCLTEGRPGFRVKGGMEAAKALAQEKLEALIRSHLVASPSPAVPSSDDRERLVEALTNLAREMRAMLRANPKKDGGLYRQRLTEAEAVLSRAALASEAGR